MGNSRYKFRAWDKEEKIMLERIESCYDGSGISGRTDHLVRYPEDYFGSFVGVETGYRSANGNRYEVMQFTGLLDKNGKEIYEDDLVRYKVWSYGGVSGDVLIDIKAQVEFNKFGQFYPKILTKNPNRNDCSLPIRWNESVEVFANIHENFIEVAKIIDELIK